MSVETDAGDGQSTEDPDELARKLGEAITDLPAYQQFLDAKEVVENDEALQEEIREFEEIREEFMLARQAGEADRDDLRELQRSQEQLHDIPEMSEFLAARNELELRLQELNVMVSDPLAVDFGETAGGCCQE